MLVPPVLVSAVIRCPRPLSVTPFVAVMVVPSLSGLVFLTSVLVAQVEDTALVGAARCDAHGGRAARGSETGEKESLRGPEERIFAKGRLEYQSWCVVSGWKSETVETEGWRKRNATRLFEEGLLATEEEKVEGAVINTE